MELKEAIQQVLEKHGPMTLEELLQSLSPQIFQILKEDPSFSNICVRVDKQKKKRKWVYRNKICPKAAESVANCFYCEQLHSCKFTNKYKQIEKKPIKVETILHEH